MADLLVIVVRRKPHFMAVHHNDVGRREEKSLLS
jgi:hypothetical protein